MEYRDVKRMIVADGHLSGDYLAFESVIICAQLIAELGAAMII